MKKILIFIFCFAFVGITSFAAIRFSDVADSYWGAEVIYKLADAGIINGYDDGTYKPLNSVTYGEFIKLVMATFLPADFETTGVDANFEHWAASYVKLAEIYGIIEEETITLDNINNYISRIEMANIVSMADMILNGSDFNNSKELVFTDIFGVVGKDRTLLQHAYSSGLIIGNPDGTFRPNDEMNRAEAATIIDRLAN